MGVLRQQDAKYKEDLFEALMVAYWLRSAKCRVISSSCSNSPAVVGVLYISECVWTVGW